MFNGFYNFGVSREELAPLLAKYHKKIGIESNEYIILNAYVMHEGFYEGIVNVNEIAEMTGGNKDFIKETFISLHERNILKIKDGKIDNRYLYSSLRNLRPLSVRLAESYNDYDYYEGYDQQFSHLGQIEVIPMKIGEEYAGLGAFNDNGLLWNLSDVNELIQELTLFTEKFTQEDIYEYNADVLRKQKEERERAEQRRKEIESMPVEPRKPKQGFIFMIRTYPDSYIKFTYTTSLSKDEKESRIREEYNDMVDILHVFETYDTMDFYHQFLKKQFTNRLVDENTRNQFQLTDEDIEYLKNEEFPSNAMEWLNGTIITK